MAPTADEAFEYEIADVVGGAIGSDPAGDTGHFLDEIDQSQIKVIFDQCEAGNANAEIGTVLGLGKRIRCGFLGGRINEDDFPSFEVRSRLAVSDDDDLFVCGRLARQYAPGQAKAGMDVGEVLGDAARGVIEVEANVDPGCRRGSPAWEPSSIAAARSSGWRMYKSRSSGASLGDSGADHRLKSQRNLLGRVVFSVAAHRAAHIDQTTVAHRV